MTATSDRIFLDFSVRKLTQLTDRIGDCLGLLSGEQVWARGGESENAVGNLVLHLCGNVRQWIVSGVGGRPDIRRRDEEFAARGEIQPDELRRRLDATVAEAVAVIEAVTPQRLLETVTPQGYQVTVLEAIYHVVEHFAQHTGQIIYATKMLTGEDLGYYRHLSRPVERADETP